MAAAVMTSALQTALSWLTPAKASGLSKDVVQLVKEDHDRARDLWAQFNTPGCSADHRRVSGYAIVREVVIHSAKEEEVLYSAIREALGDAEADHLIEEHRQLREALAELSAADPSDPNFDGTLADFIETLLHHQDEEERTLLPRFAARVGPERLKQLAAAFEVAKLHAPSRPHPLAPYRPPQNIVANVAAAPLDFALDLVRFGGAPPL